LIQYIIETVSLDFANEQQKLINEKEKEILELKELLKLKNDKENNIVNNDNNNENNNINHNKNNSNANNNNHPKNNNDNIIDKRKGKTVIESNMDNNVRKNK